MSGVIVGAGATLSVNTVAKVEAELERQMRKGRDLDHVSKNVEFNLQFFKDKGRIGMKTALCQCCIVHTQTPE